MQRRFDRRIWSGNVSLVAENLNHGRQASRCTAANKPLAGSAAAPPRPFGTWRLRPEGQTGPFSFNASISRRTGGSTSRQFALCYLRGIGTVRTTPILVARLSGR